MNNEIQDKNYIPLTPFKGFVLENFPFIEADLDAITNYQLLCKVIEYLNNVINNQNQVQELGSELVDAYNDLLEYVNNYFDNLNLQNEVNTKIDEMVEDGTLTNIIKAYIDPLYQAYETEINNNLTTYKNNLNADLTTYKNGINSQMTIMNNKVNAATSGAPLVASSTAGMTDTTKVYVNTTDGKWYYYDGDSWEIGGTYQASEDSESVEQMLKYYYAPTTNDIEYQVGTINSTTGSDGSNSERLRCEDYLSISKYKKISIDSGYQFNIFAYSSNDVETFLGYTSWVDSTEYYIDDVLESYPTATYFRFALKTTVDRTMTLADVENSNVTLYELNYATNNNLKIVSNKLDEETSIEGDSKTINFVQGSISSNNGIIDTSRNDRIVDENFYESSKVKSVTCDSDYRILIANYTSDNVSTFTSVSNWLSSPVTTFSSNFFRVVIKKNNEANITPAEITNTKINFKDTSLKDYVKSIEKPIINSCEPNIIWQCRNVTDYACPPFSKDYVKLAVENEFDRVLVYVRKTTDGYYVSIHEDTINYEARNADGTAISETISSNGQSLATLNSYDWGIKYGEEFAGMGVPMVEDVMKWASLYNIALSVHFSYSFSQEDATNIFNMASKYGLIEKMIVLPSNGIDFTRLGYFKALNENISYYVGCTYDNLVANIDSITNLLTGKNDVFVQSYPWGTVVDSTYRNYAKTHNLKLYNSTVMTQYDLFNTVGFDKGYSIIETANVPNIKTTVRNYVNNLSDE